MLWARAVDHSIRHGFQPPIKQNTRVIAFADDLLVMIRAESIGEGENNANIEMDKIANWARDNKITSNEEKSKVILITI